MACPAVFSAFSHTDRIPLVGTTPPVQSTHALLTSTAVTPRYTLCDHAARARIRLQANTTRANRRLVASATVPTATIVAAILAAAPGLTADILEANRRCLTATVCRAVNAALVALTDIVATAFHDGTTTTIVDALSNTNAVPGDLATERVKGANAFLAVTIAAERHFQRFTAWPQMAQGVDALPRTLATTAATTVISTLLPGTIGHTDAGPSVANVLCRADTTLAATIVRTADRLATPRVAGRARRRKSERTFGAVVAIDDHIIDTARNDLVGDFRFSKCQALLLSAGIGKQIDIRVPPIPIRHRKNDFAVEAGREQVAKFRTGILIGQTPVA